MPDDVVTLRLPLKAGPPIGVRCGEAFAVARQAPADADLHPYRLRLERILREAFGVAEPRRDDDGDYPFPVGETLTYLRLARRPDGSPVVQVFGTLLDRVEPSAELYEEINALNASAHFCRVFHVGGQVLVEDEVVANDLSFDELSASFDAVVSAMQRFQPLFAARPRGCPADPLGGVLGDAAARPLGGRLDRVQTGRGRTRARRRVAVRPRQQLDGPHRAQPHGTSAVPSENEAAQQALVNQLLEQGRMLSQALGEALDGSHAEPSIAVLDLPTEDGVALARQFGHAAIYVLHDKGIDLVSCLDGSVVSRRPWRRADVDAT
jgi:hypothetical protein